MVARSVMIPVYTKIPPQLPHPVYHGVPGKENHYNYVSQSLQYRVAEMGKVRKEAGYLVQI